MRKMYKTQDAGNHTPKLCLIIECVIGLLYLSIVGCHPISSDVESSAKEKNINCKEIPIYWCLHVCDGCNDFFEKIKEEQDKEAKEEKTGEMEVLIDELYTIGTWSGG